MIKEDDQCQVPNLILPLRILVDFQIVTPNPRKAVAGRPTSEIH